MVSFKSIMSIYSLFLLFSSCLLFGFIPFFSFVGLLGQTFSIVNLVVSLRPIIIYLNVSVYFQVILYRFIYKNLAIVYFHFFNIVFIHFTYILYNPHIALLICLNNYILKRCNSKKKSCTYCVITISSVPHSFV